MRTERTVTVVTWTCDRCGRRPLSSEYWAEQVTHVTLTCPPDGVNGGQVEVDLCRSCRVFIHAQLLRLVAPLAPKSGSSVVPPIRTGDCP